MFVLLSLSLLVVDVASVTITVQNHWAGGFQAEVAIPVTCDLQGWTVSLDFDQDIKSIEVRSPILLFFFLMFCNVLSVDSSYILVLFFSDLSLILTFL